MIKRCFTEATSQASLLVTSRFLSFKDYKIRKLGTHSNLLQLLCAGWTLSMRNYLNRVLATFLEFWKQVTGLLSTHFKNFSFFFNMLYLFIFGSAGFSLLSVLSLVAESGGCCLFPWLHLWSKGSRARGLQQASLVHRLRCSKAYGIFPSQGRNPCPLPWQTDS